MRRLKGLANKREVNSSSISEERYLEALKSALPVLNQQKNEN